ncbi:uncharacterized protein LOC133313155 [Gastrolobium bilobum]|uniref:uncharacterized protein LOC133313155 n=1 Tax=Gastrolobium bilobum TaxID=150636 RepID=UPI002AB145CF|nr:uncharacterized protein LOC133313155 [Gastrolobium bilobum]
MRGTIGVRLQNTNISNATRKTLVPFSTSSSSGGGGRGRGGSLPDSGLFNFNERAPGKPNSNESKSDTPESPIPPASGHGHGRGKPISPPSGLPSFSSFLSSIKQPSAGRGRAVGPLASQPEHDLQPPDSGPKKPIFFKREDSVSSSVTDDVSPPKKPIFPEMEGVVKPTARSGDNENANNLPGSILGVFSGLGRGKPMKQADPDAQVAEENRHLRTQQAPGAAASETVSERQTIPSQDGAEENRHLRTRRAPGAAASKTVPERHPLPSRDDAVKNARKILSRGDVDGSSTGRGRGFRETDELGPGRGRGRGRGRGVGRGRFRERDAAREVVREVQSTQDSYGDGLFVGDDADGEKLARKFGPEIMDQLTEGFEEMASRVLPSPLEDEYLEALDINYAIEFEPEYLMGEFDRNPDIDEKEPIPLRDALEKMKPFLMAYEGIQSQEEWEEIMEDTMARVPLLKKIVDHYSGPDRVTAKKQQEELERVAKTLPASAPSSVNQFTNRAVISLQSNPGWGFDKKCHFMDKLVWEVSQHYK